MRPTVSQYAEALEGLSREGTLQTGVLIKNFFGFLKRRGESGRAAAIVKQLEKREAARSGKLPITVVMAHELTAETEALLLKKAEALFPGQSIEPRYEIDSTVIGGARFRTDETLYDATVRTELDAFGRIIRT